MLRILYTIKKRLLISKFSTDPLSIIYRSSKYQYSTNFSISAISTCCDLKQGANNEETRESFSKIRANCKISYSHDRSPGGKKLLVSRRLASCKTFALPWRSLPFIRQNSDCVHALTPVEKERDRGKESND